MIFLVASPGGHLTQLRAWAEVLGLDPADCHWITHAGRGADELSAAGATVSLVPTVPTRGVAQAPGAAVRVGAILRRHRSRGGGNVVLTTGAAVGGLALALGSALRMQGVYIESATRLRAPSLTGRLAKVVPRVQRFSQGFRADGWDSAPWLLERFEVVERTDTAPLRGIVVLTGTKGEEYPFERLVRMARAAAAELGVRCFVQTVDPLEPPILEHEAAEAFVAWKDVEKLLRDDWVLLAHAGAGVCLDTLGAGFVPVVVPRSGDLGEHIDGHQLELAARLADEGLPVVWPDASPEWLLKTIRRASGTAVLRSGIPADRLEPLRALVARGHVGAG